ncbi:L,D-transpeptidase family protein [Fictibacillus sp. NPDC058756]|uniref:L,D-transpeptidase family protein n=1 Tax=Fictibacillus sp. NPDC058756 TaxID=3346625 RepID=UPI0036CDCE3D
MKTKKLVIGLLMFCFMFFLVQPAKAAASSFIVINKSTNQLAYFENNKLSKVFKVATGKLPSYTPEGKFKIVNKITNRPYYTGNIPGGDPRNPLGNRWLGLNARGTWGTTYAIHGNNNADSIGKYVSAGCIRMYNNDVQWLYARILVNTPVVITTSSKTFPALAAANGYKVTNGSTVPVFSIVNLKKGSRGAEVMELQRRLTDLGYSTKGIDGVFGANTDAAVRKFQKAKKLTVDGIVGPATKKALGMM